MAWVAPITWTTQLVTVANFNEQLRDNMNALKTPPSGLSYISGRDYQVAGLNAFTAVDTALVDGHFQHTITVAGTVVKVVFNGSLHPKVNNGQIAFNIAVNGVDYFPSPGYAVLDPTAMSANIIPISFSPMLTGITPGSNTFRLDWSATHTAFLLECSGAPGQASPAMFYVVEAS